MARKKAEAKEPADPADQARVEQGRQSFAEARKTAKLLQEAKASLDSTRASGTKGITWMTKGSMQRWRVQWSGAYIGLFQNLADAEEALAKFCAERHLEAEASTADVGPRSVKARILRCRAFHQALGHCIPADVEASLLAYHGPGASKATPHCNMPACSHLEMFDFDSALEVISIQGKTGPWKTALFASWGKYLGSQPGDVRTSGPLTRQQRVSRLLPILKATVEEMNGKQFPEWSSNTGKKNQFHSGWLALIGSESLKLVAHHDEGELLLGEGGGRYRWTGDSEEAATILLRLTAGSDVLKCAWAMPLQTAREWLDSITFARSGLEHASRELKVKSLPRLNHSALGTSYLFPWTFRAGALCRNQHLRHDVAEAPEASSAGAEASAGQRLNFLVQSLAPKPQRAQATSQFETAPQPKILCQILCPAKPPFGRA